MVAQVGQPLPNGMLVLLIRTEEELQCYSSSLTRLLVQGMEDNRTDRSRPWNYAFCLGAGFYYHHTLPKNLGRWRSMNDVLQQPPPTLREFLLFIIAHPRDNIPVASLEVLADVNSRTKTAELIDLVVAREYRCRGLITPFVSIVMRCLHVELHSMRIQAWTQPETAIHNLYERLGFLERTVQPGDGRTTAPLSLLEYRFHDGHQWPTVVRHDKLQKGM
ncbi:hypothetical protein PG997_006566 [Apiospora hydei]|uniref:N-acetyltransferase domain-containing protein n=1 Tax=Apiospora hydei TaxID=1337664 RepID=A0ABR1WRM0_9PEZI